MTPLLELPAGHAARVLVLRMLDTLEARRVAFEEDSSPERLHDLRVAIRRLRSLIRAYRPFLKGARLARTRKRIRRVARATNRARDADVQMIWLAAQRELLPPEEASGFDWFCDELEGRRAADYRRGRREVARSLDGLANRARRRASRYRVRVDAEEPQAEQTLGQVLGPAMGAVLAELEDHLSRAHGDDAVDEAHAARIVGKRLRYLIEPVVDELPDGPQFLKLLKRLQDLLGELNDARVLSADVAQAFAELDEEGQRERGLALVALTQALRRREKAALAELEKRWLGEAGEARLAAGHALVQRLADPMGTPEIERKYLLRGLPEAIRGASFADLEQGYLPGDRIVERIRRIRDERGVRCLRTLKQGRGVVRSELEEPISEAFFEALWPLCKGRRVHKRRYHMDAGPLVWEVDEFLDRDLVLAEVELPTPEAPPIPDWLEPQVVREVTDEDAFVNLNLAR